MAKRDDVWEPSPVYPVKIVYSGTDVHDNPCYDTWLMRGKKPLLVKRAGK